MTALDSAIRSYLNALVLQGRSPHTVRNTRSTLKELATFLSRQGVKGVEELGAEALLQFRRQLSIRPTTNGTVLAIGSQREHVGKVRSFCRWLFEGDWTTVDLGKNIPHPRRPRQLPKAILTVDEVDRILAARDMSTALGYRDRAILEVLYSTAIRRAEAAALMLDDVDTAGGYLIVREGKNSKDRVVPAGKTACQLLKGFLTHVRPLWLGAEGIRRLFLTRFGYGMGPDAIWHVVKKYALASGVAKPVSTHTFRHTCATHMARAGVPLRHLQELLGHESLETTQIYTHLAISDLKAAHMRYHPRERCSGA